MGTYVPVRFCRYNTTLVEDNSQHLMLWQHKICCKRRR